MSETDEPDILNMPREARRLIVVSNERARQAREAAAKAIAEQDQPFLDRFAGAFGSAVPYVFRGRDWQSVLVGAVVTAGVIVVTQLLMDAGSGDKDAIAVTPITHRQARRLTMPLGHPQDDVLYVAHPSGQADGTYFPLAEFHRLTFEHKLCEAVEMLMALGATRISVSHVKGWSSAMSARLSVPLPVGDAGANVDGTGKHKSSILFEAHLPGNATPELPGDLVFYPHERTWNMLAQGRIKRGMNRFSMNIDYLNDLGVNLTLNASAKKMGLSIGGKFEEHQETIWRMEGEFAPRQGSSDDVTRMPPLV